MLVEIKRHRLDTTKLTPKQRMESLIRRNSGKDIDLSDRSLSHNYSEENEKAMDWNKVFKK